MGCRDYLKGTMPVAATFALVLLLLAPAKVRADGALITNYFLDVWEPAQRAMLLFDPEAGREDLILQAEYEGNTDNLAWIVPVPSFPTLTTADAGIFVDCANLTRLVVRNRGFSCGEGAKLTGAPGNQVDVYDRQTVGIYQTLTLGASNAPALADSLDAWGYLHAGNRPRVEAALQFYIDKSWFFVAMRTDSATVAGSRPGAYRIGGLDPIRLAFATTRAVYPLRISAISARNPSQVLLYACAPHRMTFPGATTEYANRINDRELRHLQSLYPLLGTVLTRPCFLTKLRRFVPANEMDDDLFLEQAPDDHEFREVDYAGIPLAELLFLALALALYGRSRRRGRAGRALRSLP
jgi:hypothetical protein